MRVDCVFGGYFSIFSRDFSGGSILVYVSYSGYLFGVYYDFRVGFVCYERVK